MPDVGIANSGLIFLLGLLMSQFTLTGQVPAALARLPAGSAMGQATCLPTCLPAGLPACIAQVERRAMSMRDHATILSCLLLPAAMMPLPT